VNASTRTAQRLGTLLLLAIGGLLAAGCSSAPMSTGGPTVIFADGAGWSGSHKSVQEGLKAAGFTGHVEAFPWSSMLGPAHDHLFVARKQKKARKLAERIVAYRAKQPDADLHLMGLSAGTAVIVFALEQLPKGVSVDNVVLFSPSISDRHDLSTAMEHVQGNLYATCSRVDGILGGITKNADGYSGNPAGLSGLRIPSRVQRYEHYARVVNLPWRPAYGDIGWNGGHTSVVGSSFVQEVIAPRVLADGPSPLNRPLAPRWIALWQQAKSARRSQ
jgi:pimeloyl-ACP methyl ester carboxylesterase